MPERIRIDHGNLTAGKRKLSEWNVPPSVRAEVLRFLDDLALGKVNRGKRLSPQRQLKYLHALRAPLEFFHKNTARVTLTDVERFERAIESGQLRSRLTGEPYAHSTRVDIRMLLKIFLRWRLGPTKAAPLTDWLDTRVRHKTPAFLNETEIEQLYKNCRDARQRFLVAMLFDSGARAEEFHNIRFEDIYLPEGKDNFVRVALKEEYSKTLGRTVALYWRHSLDAVKDYLTLRIAQGMKPQDPVFHGSYDASRRLLWRLGHRVLKRPVHYHLLRHSSATFYASKLNRQELCYRYGWRFSSNMPDVYISRAGMTSQQLDEKFTQTELSTLKEDLTRVTQDNQIKSQRIDELRESLESMQRHVALIGEVLATKPSVHDVEQALARKRKQKG